MIPNSQKEKKQDTDQMKFTRFLVRSRFYTTFMMTIIIISIVVVTNFLFIINIRNERE